MDLEVNNKKAPVLLKKYLSLGGQIISFNIDPNFNDTLDGLLLLDLYDVDPKIRKTLFEGFGSNNT